jgi:hypothetical protein
MTGAGEDASTRRHAPSHLAVDSRALECDCEALDRTLPVGL